MSQRHDFTLHRQSFPDQGTLVGRPRPCGRNQVAVFFGKSIRYQNIYFNFSYVKKGRLAYPGKKCFPVGGRWQARP